MSSMTILLHSKYSPQSQKLIKIISANRLVDLLDLRSVCVDNDKVRQQILQNNHIDLTEVPCLVILKLDGNISKFEGQDAVAWIDDFVRQQNLENEKIEQERQLREEIEELKKLKAMAPPLPPVKHDRGNPDDDDYNDGSPSGQVTMIGDIQDVGGDSGGMPVAFPPNKQASLRSGPGSYELNSEFGGETPDTGRMTVRKGIRENLADTPGTKYKGDNIMTRALELQKTREATEPDDRKRPII